MIDELGYLPLRGEAASALLQVVSQRYLKTSIVLSTNRGVAAWGEILGDTTSPPPCSTASCTAPSCSTGSSYLRWV